MPIELRWIANRSASAMHALGVIATDRSVTDDALAQQLAAPAATIAGICRELAIGVEPLFDHLVPESAAIEAPTQLIDVVLRKAVGSTVAADVAPRFVAALIEAKATYATSRPNILDELELRSGPLRELWEARGPGLLHGIGRRTEPGLIVDRADVLLVEPVTGGGGTAHLAYNTVNFEAVLANPYADLPEIARLAWFLAQLSGDLPRYSEQLDPGRCRQVSALAMLPPTLAAAADVELLHDSPAMLSRAIERWQPGDATLAQTVTRWWQTYTANRPPWPVALAALDQMVAELA
ncbi:MAG TPA: hypothetical protein VHZ24_00225 [Pirellulales bacterium]|jgi:hypothetical protein|nr:hypothetical protein [Pirellulales bacterium]